MNMVKYIQRRINGKPTKLYTCIGWCETCGELFFKIGKGSGSRKYCSICAKNSKRESNRRAENNRAERNEYKAELAVKLRGEGIVIDKRVGRNNMCGKPPENPTDRDWMEYHNKIKKMKKDTLGGYQDYYDIDDEEGNTYE